jgi:predicted lipid-binding transport protein (Tim44 family)
MSNEKPPYNQQPYQQSQQQPYYQQQQQPHGYSSQQPYVFEQQQQQQQQPQQTSNKGGAGAAACGNCMGRLWDSIIFGIGASIGNRIVNAICS